MGTDPIWQKAGGEVTALSSIRTRARNIKRDVIALWIAARDPRVPWYAKLAAGAVAAYALGQIDLIPDFIPVLGYLEDVIIVPLGILLAVRLVPAPLMAAFRQEAMRRTGRPNSYWAMATIVVIWLVAAVWLVWMFWPAITSRFSL